MNPIAPTRTLIISASILLGATSISPAAEEPLLAQLPTSVACLHVRDGARFVSAVERLKLLERIMALPGVQTFWATPKGNQVQQGIRYLETRFQKPPLELARTVFAGEWVVAAVPVKASKPEVRPVALARPRHVVVFRDVLSVLVALAQGTPAQLDETPTVEVGDGLFFWVGDTLVAGTRDAAGKQALRGIRDQLLERSTEPGSADSGRPEGAAGRLLRFNVDFERLAEHTEYDPASLEQPASESLESLLFGGLAKSIARAKTLQIDLEVSDHTLALRGLTDALDLEGLRPFFPHLAASTGEPSVIPNPVGTIARLDLDRDLAGWFEQRRAWIQARAQAGIDEFLVNFGNLTGGLDFAEDLLEKIPGPLQLFAVRLPDHEPAPTPRLPGFAVVAPLGSVDAQDFERRLRLALQSVVTFINLEQGQKGQSPYLIESELHRGVRLTRAAPVPPPRAAGTARGIEFNFAPTVAIAENCAILASHDDAARRVVDTLADHPSTRSATNASFEVVANELVDILRRNRDSLVAGQVLEGDSLERAGIEIDALFEIIDWFDHAAISLQVVDRRLDLRASVELEPARPEVEDGAQK